MAFPVSVDFIVAVMGEEMSKSEGLGLKEIEKGNGRDIGFNSSLKEREKWRAGDKQRDIVLLRET